MEHLFTLYHTTFFYTFWLVISESTLEENSSQTLRTFPIIRVLATYLIHLHAVGESA